MVADEPDVQADPGDAVNTDLSSAVDSEDMDEDRLGVDPLESGMDPPERWVASDKFGVTADEQRRGETLDQRLAEERPDIGTSAGDEPAGTGGAQREPDESGRPPADDVTTVEPPTDGFDGAADEPARDLAESPSDTGRAADVAGGSVAEAERRPDEERPDDTGPADEPTGSDRTGQ